MEEGSPPASLALLHARDDFRDARCVAVIAKRGAITFELRAGRTNVWVVARCRRIDLFALRSGFEVPLDGPPCTAALDKGHVCEWQTALGATRLKITFPAGTATIVHCTLSLLPSREVRLSSAARDLYLLNDPTGAVHTTQRGLRSGVFYATGSAPVAFSAMYFQDFSSLTDLFEVTHESPSGTVGGTLDEAGFLPRFGDEGVLPSGRELVMSDAYLAIVLDEPPTQAGVAERYLDLLADIYVSLPLPAADYRDWPDRAARTLRDLALSPACTYERGGSRFLMPYVGDTSKPPESMVQLTVLVNTLEYDSWRRANSMLARTLVDGFERFYSKEIDCVVRWLPGETFGKQSEEHMDHESMDSWYLYHSLFNISRLATMGNATARRMLRASLPYAIRLAHRFDYRWPIFFNLKTLDIIRAESSPGAGGERDVTGLYALLLLHAHELFGDAEYLKEAKRAAEPLGDLSFHIGYQLNTTSFAAEAMLRLWKLTGERRYLELSEVCMANIFDNMWIWKCDYGRARCYRTFFGLFPLHDAPYLAAYEEAESQAKFHEFLLMGGTDLRPSLRLLLAEYQRNSLDRGWFYYPDALPLDSLAKTVRNGKVERGLSIPLEDLQDGRSACGEVGQEIYGAGLAFIYATRHYRAFSELNAMLYCSYPLSKFTVKAAGGTQIVSFHTGGDPRGACEFRVIAIDPDQPAAAVSVVDTGRNGRATLKPETTVEGHQSFPLLGDRSYAIRIRRAPRRRRVA